MEMEKKYVKNYESFKTGDAINEENIFKALGNLFKGIFKRLNDKITKLGEDFAAQKKFIKTDILNPKSTDSLLAPLFKEYNAKSQFTDQDCFDFVRKLVDPDDGVLSQLAIQGFVKEFKNENDKKAWTYILEKMRNNMMVFLNYGGQVAKNFKLGQPLPKPAIKLELKSGNAIKRTADGKNFVEVLPIKKENIHLPLLKKLIAPLTDDKKKAAVLNWINTTVLPQMFKFSDALNEQEVDRFSGEGKAVEGKPGEAVAMDYQKLYDIYEKQKEVIFLLPGIEKDKYVATKSPEEQKDVVGVAKMKALNDQNNDQSITFDYDGKEIKMGYGKIIGLAPENAQSGEENTEAFKSYGVEKPEELVGKEVYYMKDGFDKNAPSADLVGKNEVTAFDEEKGLTIKGKDEKTFEKGIDQLISMEEGDKLTGNKSEEESKEPAELLADLDEDTKKNVLSYADFIKNPANKAKADRIQKIITTNAG